MAISMMDNMVQATIQPDRTTINLVGSACEQSSRWGFALPKLVQQHMKQHPDWLKNCRERSNYMLGKSVLEDKWQNALRAIDEMRTLGIKRSPKYLNLVAESCEGHARWNQALKILNEIKEMDNDLNANWFTSVVRISARSHRWRSALRRLREMNERGFKQKPALYNELMKAFDKLGFSVFANTFRKLTRQTIKEAKGYKPEPGGDEEEALLEYIGQDSFKSMPLKPSLAVQYQLFWPEEKEWYNATFSGETGEGENSGKSKFVYEDGSIEWLDYEEIMARGHVRPMPGMKMDRLEDTPANTRKKTNKYLESIFRSDTDDYAAE